MALYNKYRPTNFDLVCGQEHIKKILTQQIKRNALSNAYLFLGSAGTGKTTLARILCAMVNCSTGMTLTPDPNDKFVQAILSGRSTVDVTEIDAASNGHVDDVRALRDQAQFAPIEMAKKIWIIDECHKLTLPAWQALLKIIEEPPSHVMFIFCTTDPQNIPDTIITRSMTFQFHAFSPKDIAAYLKKVVGLEGKVISDDCLRMVANSAKGSMRQAISNLEKVMLLDNCTPEEIAKTVSLPSRASSKEFLYSALSGKFAVGLKASSELIASGVSAQDFLEEVANYVHDLMLCGLPGHDLQAYGYSSEEVAELKAFYERMAKFFRDPLQLLQKYVQHLDMGHKLTAYNIQPQFHVDAVWVDLYRKAQDHKNIERKEPGTTTPSCSPK